ncbi:thioredoxin reductase [Naegleria gruberi]|uniref:thioredoxin-disulfide reductase (NADPH) n=1 Tax=Naegleria gruberi TaxID=5762 RepID=D2VLQ6_NAEGR|nr:thioredoxin reductase [Naegleria gruberi]EFC42180.1 thioredoxin reductase [Naegleria gruberi]|eukprot:XP_002674924.1 thioredoxin reductase [Naegleria gruberi strain NEG-M]
MSEPVIDTQEPETDHGYDYDLIVIGGGSGGIALAKEANALGAKVAVFDYIKPSPQGTTWGLGGTCVNVGCIPKKLMHTAALIGDRSQDGTAFGWTNSVGHGTERKPHHQWGKLVEMVQDHIHGLNFKYRTDLRKKGITYHNLYASFIDAHTVEGKKDGQEEGKRFTARRFAIAVGGRPLYPDIPGAKEYCISSDDIFSMEKEPGKSLVVGASYVALECGGFLHGIGNDTTIMVRSVPLRGFDRECADKIVNVMSDEGVKFYQPCVPLSVNKLESGKLSVEYENVETKEKKTEEFDTVLFATGRYALTQALNLENIGVKTDKVGKIFVNKYEQSSVPHIYAIGDVIVGGLELTPVAIKAGKLLAARLYNSSKKMMDYDKVPTTVFTPVEYGSCGLTEEEAVKRYGAENLTIYKKSYYVLEYEPPARECQAFVKLICNELDNERVLGFHYVGPNAGEVTQGFAVAMRCNATKEDFDDTVGIHPTCAETIVKLEKGVETDTGC